MLSNKTIAAVVPCHNEENQIRQVLETMPDFVDKIIVIDDKSSDKTIEVVERMQIADERILFLKHAKKLGTGAARISGLKKCLETNADLICLLDGDGQMDINELPNLIEPIIEGNADIVKGNRFFSGEAWEQMPRVRYLGNAFLSLLTKIVSGYWHIADFQSGYIVIKREIIELIDLEHLYKSYGFPNDLLIHANIYNAKVVDVPIKPIYRIGEKSGIRYEKIIPSIGWLLFRRFFWRLKEKYIIRDFHPLVFFYFFGLMLLLISIPLTIRFFLRWYIDGRVPEITSLALMFVLISGFQFIFFAMWFDMNSNKNNE